MKPFLYKVAKYAFFLFSFLSSSCLMHMYIFVKQKIPVGLFLYKNNFFIDF